MHVTVLQSGSIMVKSSIHYIGAEVTPTQKYRRTINSYYLYRAKKINMIVHMLMKRLKQSTWCYWEHETT